MAANNGGKAWLGRHKMTLLLPFFAYLGWLALLFVTQHRLLFPRGYVIGNPEARPDYPAAGEVALSTPDGLVPAWWFPPRGGATTVALIAHGNAELAQGWFDVGGQLAAAGVGAVVVEYPGYGRAPGSPSQASIARVLDAAHDFAVRQVSGGTPRVVGLGSSVGAAAICDLTRRRELAAMALIAPFRSLKPMAWRHLAPPFLLRSPFDNAAALSRYRGPVLIFHGTRDSIIPFSDAEQLAALDPDFELVAVDAGHNDIHAHWNSLIAPRVIRLFRDGGGR